MIGLGLAIWATSVPAAPNLLASPNAFDAADWTKVGSTVTANAGAAPDGSTTADLLKLTSTSFYNGLYQAVTSKHLSIDAKASGKRWVGFVNAAGSAGAAWFDLQTGAVGTVASGYTAGITDLGSGWYRCTLDYGSNFSYFQLFISDADNNAVGASHATNGILLANARAT